MNGGDEDPLQHDGHVDMTLTGAQSQFECALRDTEVNGNLVDGSTPHKTSTFQLQAPNSPCDRPTNESTLATTAKR